MISLPPSLHAPSKLTYGGKYDHLDEAQRQASISKQPSRSNTWLLDKLLDDVQEDIRYGVSATHFDWRRSIIAWTYRDAFGRQAWAADGWRSVRCRQCSNRDSWPTSAPHPSSGCPTR